MKYSLEPQESVPYHEFHEMMEKYQLVPDWWRDDIDEALALHDFRHIWRIALGDETVGWLWFEALIPRRQVILGIVVESAHRREWHKGLIPEIRGLVWFLMKDHDLRRMVVLVRKGRRWAETFFRKRLGFQFEGYAREAFSLRDKDYPLVQLSLTKGDLQKVGEKYHASTSCFRVGDGRIWPPWPTFEGEAGEVPLSGDGGRPRDRRRRPKDDS